MSLLITNTGTAAQLFADFQTAMGTTLGWVLFDDVSPTQKVFTVPAQGGQGPAFLELTHDTVGFTVYFRIWQDWNNITHVGTGDAPSAIDSVSANGFDFTSAIATVSYRIFGTSRFIGGTFNTVSGIVSSMWAGLMTTLASAVQYVVPVGLFSSTGSAFGYRSFWRTDAGVAFTNSSADIFELGNYAATTEGTSGKTPATSVFAFGPAGQSQLPGSADDLLQVPRAAVFDDILTIGADTYRVGKNLAFKVN